MTIRFRHPAIGGAYGFCSQDEAQARLAQLLNGCGGKHGLTPRQDGLSLRPHRPMSATFALKATQV